MKSKTLIFWVYTILFNCTLFGQGENFKEKDNHLHDKFAKVSDIVSLSNNKRYEHLTRSEAILYDETLLNASVFVKSINGSGRIIFNSEAGDYLNEIKGHLLKGYPDLDALITVYVTRDNSVNAFATIGNNIFVNIGLLAELENEAQLAYILSHEIMHIVNEHIIEEVLDVNAKVDSYSTENLTNDDDIVQLYRHEISQKAETEADIDGLHLYSESGYAMQEAYRSLQLLKELEQRHEDKELSTLFFSKEALTLYSDSLLIYMAVKDTVDNQDTVAGRNAVNSTHPLIEDRISKLEELIASTYRDEGGVRYQISEEQFLQIKKEASLYENELISLNFDFLPIFLKNSNGSSSYENKEQLDYLSYSIQGLVVDKLKGYEYSMERAFTNRDSLFLVFYEKSSNADFCKWGIEALADLYALNHDDERLAIYLEKTLQNVKIDNDSIVDSLLLVNENLAEFKSMTAEPTRLTLDSIDFRLTTYTNFKAKMKKDFNKSVIPNPISGKIAVAQTLNLYLDRSNFPVMNYAPNAHRTDEMDNKVYSAMNNLEEDFEGTIQSFNPNGIEYTAKDYEAYVSLKEWTNERSYFDGYAYESIFSANIQDLRKQYDVDYAMITLNLDVKGVNTLMIMGVMFTGLFQPTYIPSMITNSVATNSRKFQLSIVFDLSSGELVMWDKRSYIEPNSVAQLTAVYTDLLNTAYGKK